LILQARKSTRAGEKKGQKKGEGERKVRRKEGGKHVLGSKAYLFSKSLIFD
jgi:hypothetical protein